MGNDAFNPKREGGVLGGRARGGILEGLCGGGKLSAKVERDPT